MTIIKILVFFRACGAIEPCLFIAYYSTMFPTAVYSVDPTFQGYIFLHNMYSISTDSRKDIWRIRSVGQGKNKISEATEMASGSRSGVYWALLYRGGISSMVVGGRCIAGLPKSAARLYFPE